ncbi:MAG: stage II sporulation protein P, partial [Eubacteriales bacterium]|nr:stage II sporulation protein P [Eubacteriales bacterium]
TNGKQAAQAMLVMETNQGGANHPIWEQNLTVAVALQNIINNDYPTLMRPICLRSASFNQQLTTGSMLLEIGSCGNTLEEAKYTAELIASAITKMIYSN